MAAKSEKGQENFSVSKGGSKFLCINFFKIINLSTYWAVTVFHMYDLHFLSISFIFTYAQF